MEPYLMTGEYQCVGNNNILTTASGKYNNLSDVFGSQWLATPIDVRLGLLYDIASTYA